MFNNDRIAFIEVESGRIVDALLRAAEDEQVIRRDVHARARHPLGGNEFAQCRNAVGAIVGHDRSLMDFKGFVRCRAKGLQGVKLRRGRPPGE